MTIRNALGRLALIAALLWLSLIYLTPPVAAQDPPLEEEAATPFDHRFGLVDSFVNVEEANAAGAGWSRIFLRWDVVQPGGPADWKPANVPDTFLDAEIASGREIVAVLIGTPAWATASGDSTAVPPLEYWGDFVSKIASQYRGRINHWVIWHQPDVTDPASSNHTWDGTEEDYYRLLKEAYLKIKAVDPAMQVHLAGLTYTWDRERGQTQYLARLLTVITADPEAAQQNFFFDAASYHLYFNPVQMVEILTEVSAILTGYGLSKPIWLNETNAPPSVDPLISRQSPSGASITLEEQSAFVIQSFALALASGAQRIAFNKLRDDPGGEPYGLLREDNSRRPAFDAYRVVTRHLTGIRAAARQQGGNVYIVTLDRGGQTTTVLWSTDRTPATFLLSAIAPQALLVDEQGNEQTITATNGSYTIELPGATCSNGADCFIGGAPRLLIESGSAEQRAPLELPAAPPPPTPTGVPTETPVPATPTTAPLPTLTPLPSSIAPPTPFTDATGQASNTAAMPALEAAPPPAALPETDLLPQSESTEPTPTATVVPPVTMSTVLKPSRLIWLFIVAILVFTVSYGIQVMIWYRLRR